MLEGQNIPLNPHDMLHVKLESEDSVILLMSPQGATQNIVPPIGSLKPVLFMNSEILKLLLTSGSVKLSPVALNVSFCWKRRKANLDGRQRGIKDMRWN